MSNLRLSSGEAVSGNYCLKLDGYYLKAWENYEMADFHKHDRIEFMYVEEGECDVWLFNESAKQNNYSKLLLGKGDGILIDSDEWHRLIVNGKCTIINFEFLLLPSTYSVNTLKEAVFLSPVLSGFLSKFKSFSNFFGNNNVRRVAKLLLGETENADAFSDYENVLNMYGNLLLIEIARSHKKVMPMTSYNPYVKKALKYIDSHIKERLTMDDIAKYAQVNYAHLERLFKENMGMTLVEYISKQKVALAETFLSNTSLSIAGIAEHLGFGSRQQFNNAFKRIKGVSPQKYRLGQADKDKEMWYGFSGDYAFEIMRSNKKK